MNADCMVAIDLCCGGGGWACAARGLPVRIELAVDLWEPACRTYEINHPQVRVHRQDLRDTRYQDYLLRAYAGRTDLVLGGIPCEWLSIRRNVGDRPNEEEVSRERATLAAVLELVERLGARWWCLEDVKGLVRELPVGTPWIELDSADFSAQRRKRVYVGRFPRPQGFGPLLERGCEQTLVEHLRPGPYRIGKRSWGRRPGKAKTFSAETVYGVHAADKAPTICCLSSRRDAEMVILDGRLPGGMRQMEWQEAARIQGFPEEYLFWGSPTDVWTMIGRAVQIDTGRAILRGIVRDWQARLELGV